ncbi:hypothetical protein WG66_008061 [Moniliophthora roreri]|nr:hypothetical protein WG66_008061 [Moniliophthora roreri]
MNTSRRISVEIRRMGERSERSSWILEISSGDGAKLVPNLLMKGDSKGLPCAPILNSVVNILFAVRGRVLVCSKNRVRNHT